jgi:tRNA modification GTPase
MSLIQYLIPGYFQEGMNEAPLSLNDPIVALATPWGKSAVAVIRTSGDGCISLTDAVFQGPHVLAERDGHTLSHGYVVDPSTGEKVDEVLAAVFHGPRSYTGEDAVELHLHGGLPTIARVLDVLRTQGFRDASPGEFTLRAFINNKLDLTRAEAVNDIVNARSDRARALALSRLSGKLHDVIDSIKNNLVAVLAGIEVMIDYPDETNAPAPDSIKALGEESARVESLLHTYAAGRMFQEGAVAVVAGRTNAGKSTLFNLLLKEDRSIVSAEHGTTRDFIEAAVTVAGIPIRLIDTAGLRDAAPRVEEEGIRRTRRMLEGADLIMYLVDASVGLSDEDRRILDKPPGKAALIRLWTKIDASTSPAPRGFIPVSALTHSGFPELETAVRRALVDDRTGGDTPAPLIDSLRQKEALEAALTAINRTRTGLETNASCDLLAADLREAVDALGRITGEVTSTDVLETIFSHFCVGK